MRKKDSTLSNEVLENLNSQFSENHPYRRSFSGFAFQLQFGVALGDDMFYDSKAQSRAAGVFVAAIVHTLEAFEYPLLMLLGVADAGVFYHEIGMSFSGVGLYIHTSSRIVIPDRVITQII